MAQSDTKLVEVFEEFFHRHYPDQIDDLAERYSDEQKSLYVDWQVLYRFDEDLAEGFLNRPDRFTEAAEEALRIYDHPTDVKFGQARVRLYNLAEKTKVDDIRSGSINTLVSVRGTVETARSIESHIDESVFVCQRCGAEFVIPQPAQNQELQTPYQCMSCERQGPFKLDSEKSEFIDRRWIRLQKRPTGQTTSDDLASIMVLLTGEITEEIDPGDHLTVTGIVRYDEENTYDATIVDKYLEGVSVTDSDSYDGLEVTEEDKRRIVEISHAEDVYEQMIDSVAPTIHGYERAKLAIVLQAFGGVSKNLPDGSTIRGDIHTLLVGDPSTGKSALLDALAHISPRSVRTSGRTTSGVGLTAAAERSSEGRNNWELRAGALVLGDQGHVAIDHLDHMQAEDRSAMLEALSEQTVSVSKGSINDVLRARTSVSAATNPKYGRFDHYEPIGEQLELSPTLLSRFDLIFMVTDQPDEETDAEIARHVLRANYAGEVNTQREQTNAAQTPSDKADDALEEIAPAIDADLLQKYVAYARRNCFPTTTEEARDAIEEFYVELRSKGTDEDAPVPVTARKLEGLIRLAEASARVRLSDTVEKEDADRAIEIVRECLRDLGVDPETGEFDQDVTEAERSKTQRDRVRNLLELIGNIEEEFADGAPIEEVTSRAAQVGIDPDKVDHEITKLKRQGEVYESKRGYVRTT